MTRIVASQLAKFARRLGVQPAAPYDETFRFDGLPVLQPDQMPWRKRAGYRRGWHNRVALAVFDRYAPPKPIAKARITCVRRSSAQPDADNLGYSFKQIIDGYVKAGILQDDTPEHIETEYRWERAAPKAGHVEIRIEEVV